MEKTGMFREIDKLGRIVIPMEMRKTLNIKEGDPLEITLDNGAIILRSMKTRCEFCNAEYDLAEFSGKYVCRNCLEKLKRVF